MCAKKLSGKNIAVTGAGGFVGAALCERLLDENADVTALLHTKKETASLKARRIEKDVEKTEVDILDKKKLGNVFSRGDFDFCVHLAAQAAVRTDPKIAAQTMKINGYGTWNVLRESVNSDVKYFVLASSGKVYGKQKSKKLDETAGLNSATVYGKSKIFAEKIAQTFQNSHKISVSIIRASNIYGPGDTNFTRLVPSAMRALLECEKLKIFGNGTSKRDFIFIDDVTEAYIKVLEALYKRGVAGDAFNIATQRQTSAIELAKLASRVSGRNLNLKFEKSSAKEEDENLLSIAKAKKILEWKPKYSLEKGLAKTFDFYRGYLE